MKETVPVCAPSVVVAIIGERLLLVEYANPDWVAFAPPVAVIDPLNVMLEVETPDAAKVARVGATTFAVGVTEFDAVEAELVPSAFTA